MYLLKVALLLTVAYIATGHTLNSNQPTDNSTGFLMKPAEFDDYSTELPITSAKFDLNTNISIIEPRINIEKGCCEPTNPQLAANDCYTLYDRNRNFKDGIYTISIGDNVVRVWCDMTNEGWIVLQKRFDGSVDYDRTFNEYAAGFGDLNGEYWLGLNTMSQLTKTETWTLRIDLEDFSGETAWAEYNKFRVGLGPDFALFFDKSSYKGTAGNTDGLDLSFHHGCKFSTHDVDQDGENCAIKYYGGGGFWYDGDEGCAAVLTTGMPYNGDNSIKWYPWKRIAALKSATLRIKQTKP